MRCWVWFALALVVLGSGACQFDTGRAVGVTLREYAVEVDRSSVSRGTVKLRVANRGRTAHEVIVLRTGLDPDALPLRDDRADLEAAGDVVGGIDDMVLDAGVSATATFDLAPGRYVLLCNLQYHYQTGMHAALRVTE